MDCIWEKTTMDFKITVFSFPRFTQEHLWWPFRPNKETQKTTVSTLNIKRVALHWLPCCIFSTQYPRQHPVHCVTSDQNNTLGSATCNRNIHPWLSKAAQVHSVSQSPGCRNNQTEHLISSHCAAFCCLSSFCQGGKWPPNWEGNLLLSVTEEKH